MKHVGIMGGSFNPVHIGHVIIADFVRQHAGLDEVWLMLSPLNPLKSNPAELADDSQRLAMLSMACDSVAGIEASDMELGMPRPSYTCDTLAELSRRYPDTSFSLIIGGDNWAVFDRWKNHDKILARHEVIVYPRPGSDLHNVAGNNVKIVDAPSLEISSTSIRQQIREGYDMNLLLPRGVYKYIVDHNLYT